MSNRWAALFVVHRLTPIAAVARHLEPQPGAQFLVLGTHRAFPTERAALEAAAAPARLEFCTFAELFDDAAQAAIDDRVSRELRASGVPPHRYTDTYESRALDEKNRAAVQRILRRGTFERVFVHEGLGVSLAPWSKLGAAALAAPVRPPRATLLARLSAAVRRRLSRRAVTVAVVEEGPRRYVFVSELRRLQVRAGTAAAVQPWSSRSTGADHFASVALHAYSPRVHALGLPVLIFVDSYLPTNYPRTYVDSYADAKFVCPDPFSARWLRAHGRETIRPPDFIAIREFQSVVAAPRPRTVVLLLNHAGDWSALINRSDTDALVEGFARLARAFPQLQCIVRPHPGMDHPRHEGRGASARIRDFVARCGAPNLSVSSASLAEDLARGDLFFSEYSATLLDAWQTGRLGAAVNVTGRRSFMQDFADLGFAQLQNYAAWEVFMAETIASPAGLAERQSTAAARYNGLLRDYLATK